MTKKRKDKYIKKIQEICQELGCSCMRMELFNNPHKCDIIKKLLTSNKKELANAKT